MYRGGLRQSSNRQLAAFLSVRLTSRKSGNVAHDSSRDEIKETSSRCPFASAAPLRLQGSQNSTAKLRSGEESSTAAKGVDGRTGLLTHHKI